VFEDQGLKFPWGMKSHLLERLYSQPINCPGMVWILKMFLDVFDFTTFCQVDDKKERPPSQQSANVC
jgi:hypothetical protein